MAADTSMQGAAGRIVLELSPTAENPRNSEGSFVELRDGRIAFFYTQYHGGNDDHSAARIAVIESVDDGLTWSRPRVVLEGVDGRGRNIMSVSAVQLPDGRLALFHIFTRDAEVALPMVCISTDDGQTWSGPRSPIMESGYFVLNNDRVILTHDRRLVMPLNQHRRAGARGVARWFYSDDEGETWRESRTRGEIGEGHSGLQESGVVELADRSLFSWARTDLGCQYEFRSHDGGVTWEGPSRGPLVSPLSAASIKRVPGTAALLALYNDHSGQFPFRREMRTPLVAGVSRDGGRSWPWRRLVEPDLTAWYHYIAIHFTATSVVLAYNAGNDRMAKFTSPLRIRRIPQAWLGDLA